MDTLLACSKTLFIISAAGILISCTTSPKTTQFRNSDLSNYNPAPKSMSPPAETSEDPIIDPTHIRTQADYHFTLGEALSLDGETDKAIEEFKLATVYDNASSTIRLRLGGEYLKKGLLTEAVEQAELALKLEPENIDVHLFLGGLYSAMKLYKQALQRYIFVLDKEPSNDEVMIYVGALYAEQEKYEDAERYFLKATKLQTNEKVFLAYYYLGKMHLGIGKSNYTRAVQAFTKSLQSKPDFDEAALALFDVYVALNEKKKSLLLLESFQEQFGPKKSVAYQLSQTYLDAEEYEKAMKHLGVLESFEPSNLNVKVKIALILIEQKNYDLAIEKLEQIIALSPTSDKIRFYLAAVYEEKQNYDLAIKNFNKIESASTYYPDAIVHAAYLYRKNKDLDSAAQLMEKAILTRDDVPQFYAFYASVLDEQKKYKKGIEMLEKALQKFSDNTQLRFYLGSMYDRVGRRNDTIAELRKVLAVEADHAQALNYLAYTFAEVGENLAEAEQMALKAIGLMPKDPFVMDTVGWVMFKQGRVEDAIQYLEAAHRMKPDESVIAEHLGDAYYVFELAEKAKEMYLKAVSVEVDPAKISKIKSKILTLQIQVTGQRSPASARGE